MADALSLTSNVQSFNGMRVTSLLVDPGNDVEIVADISANNNAGLSALEFFALADLGFAYTSNFQINDANTGAVVNIAKSDRTGEISFQDSSIVMTFHATESDFHGALQGQKPCFASGTRLATPNGTIAVEALRPGDMVTTLSGPAAVTWMGHRRKRDVDVIRVRAGTLGARCDLIVSADHALHVDSLLVPAGLLVDGEGIVRERRDEITFWHVELGRHAILLADGVEAESYLDTGNRQQFGNCPLAYDPVKAMQDPCAEMVLAGERLELIKTKLRFLTPA